MQNFIVLFHKTAVKSPVFQPLAASHVFGIFNLSKSTYMVCVICAQFIWPHVLTVAHCIMSVIWVTFCRQNSTV